MISFLGRAPRSKAALKKFWEALLLKPSISGVGVDVKKLLEGLGDV